MSRWTLRAGPAPAWAALALVLAVAGPAPATRGAFVVSSNLSAPVGGLEPASSTAWVASSFGTGGAALTLDTVTLLLANTGPGVAEVDLYADGLLAPGSLVARLAQTSALSASASQVSFAATGTVNLRANSTYWVVLKATSGSLSWAWTASNAGTGAGFQHTFGTSDDAGATWFTYDTYPAIMQVTANAAGAGTVPEPGSLALCGVAAAVLGLGHAARSRLRRPDGR